MQVGDLVQLLHPEFNAGKYTGVVIARHNNPEFGAGWEYEVLWSDGSCSFAHARDLEVISAAG